MLSHFGAYSPNADIVVESFDVFRVPSVFKDYPLLHYFLTKRAYRVLCFHPPSESYHTTAADVTASVLYNKSEPCTAPSGLA